MDPKHITIKEASEISGFSTEYIRQLVREGKIKGEKFGWQWIVDKDSLMEYLRYEKVK